MSINCGMGGRCGGCPWIHLPIGTQLQQKKDHFRAAWAEWGLPSAPVEALEIISPGEAGLRDRTDLTLIRREGRSVLGLWDLEHQEVLPVAGCPAVNPLLLPWIDTLSGDPPPGISRASMRLRVAPGGQRGLWLDLANLDVKDLLDEKDWLRRRMAEAWVEIGQRRKPLRDDGTRLSLGKEVELHPWSTTWLQGGRQVPLYGVVGGFTQVGVVANRHLVDQVNLRAEVSGVTRWVELGCGNGNFTLPLASRGWEVVAIDADETALFGLKRSLVELKLESRVEVVLADMNKPASLVSCLGRGEGLLVDPPRSGLGAAVEALSRCQTLPPHILYLSCYQDSLLSDLSTLTRLGYQPGHVLGIDQFPETPHCEWLVSLSL